MRKKYRWCERTFPFSIVRKQKKNKCKDLKKMSNAILPLFEHNVMSSVEMLWHSNMQCGRRDTKTMAEIILIDNFQKRDTTFSHFCIVRLYWTSFTGWFLCYCKTMSNSGFVPKLLYNIFFMQNWRRTHLLNVYDLLRIFFSSDKNLIVMDNINTINEKCSTMDQVNSIRPHSNCMWFMSSKKFFSSTFITYFPLF